MPKVGQVGSTMFWGGSITKSITIKSTKLPQTKIITIQKNGSVYQVYKIYRLVTNTHQIDTRYTKVARCTRNERYKQFTP